MPDHSSTLLLFGATGDLSRRMLLPSLYALHEDGLIDPTLRIVGTARSVHDDAEFRELARAALLEFLPTDRRDDAQLASFLERLEYARRLQARRLHRTCRKAW